MSADLKAQLAELRKERDAKWEEARNADRDYKQLTAKAESLARYLHELDGAERDCPGHDYRSGPSGRGIGFDDKCRHCGHFRTLYPIF